ncbi:general secretion pathway protein GspK [Comamonadaceae bacterium OH2545_COT-014]|nr:general secretion pathway protein GspK [Comamonadaceae bacterium OH2545_COT-014]
MNGPRCGGRAARPWPGGPRQAARARHAHRGAALLAAMLTVALVATLAAAALWQQWRGVEVEAAERTRVQSSWLLGGALDWGRLILRVDSDLQMDHLGEPWAVPLAEARLSTFLTAGADTTDLGRDAFLSGGIADLQARMNLRHLAPAPGADPRLTLENYLRFERLFDLLGLPATELRALADHLAAAQAALHEAPQGQAALAAPMPLHPGQLGWLGVSPATQAALAPYITVLPQPTHINLNTASAPVIHAVTGIDLASAERLVAARASQPFKSLTHAADAAGAARTLLLACPPQWCDVRSSFFEVRGRLRLDDVALEEIAAVQRGAGRYPPVIPLWRLRVPLSLPAGD